MSRPWCKRLHSDAEMPAGTQLQHTQILIFRLMYCRAPKRNRLHGLPDITNDRGMSTKIHLKIHRWRRRILRAGAWEREDALRRSLAPVSSLTIRDSGRVQPLLSA